MIGVSSIQHVVTCFLNSQNFWLKRAKVIGTLGQNDIFASKNSEKSAL